MNREQNWPVLVMKQKIEGTPRHQRAELCRRTQGQLKKKSHVQASFGSKLSDLVMEGMKEKLHPTPNTFL